MCCLHVRLCLHLRLRYMPPAMHVSIARGWTREQRTRLHAVCVLMQRDELGVMYLWLCAVACMRGCAVNMHMWPSAMALGCVI